MQFGVGNVCFSTRGVSVERMPFDGNSDPRELSKAKSSRSWSCPAAAGWKLH
jgi:hypothetical protein